MCPVFPGIPDYSTKLSCIYELVRSLPPSNHDTMKLLFGHLRRYARFLKKKSFLFYFIPFPSNNLRTSSRLKKKKRKKKIPTPHIIIPFFSLSDRVIQYGDDNRMTVQNVAIVFGPTLLRPETESSNITMYMVFQNQIVEFILNEYERIFYSS